MKKRNDIFSLIQKLTRHFHKGILSACFLVNAISLQSQNLVPNGDFEQNTGCPTSTGQLFLCTDWFSPSTIGQASDYHNACSTHWSCGVPKNSPGYQKARSGNAYSGLITYINAWPINYREYIEVQLQSTLEADTCYHFSMYINLGNNRQYTSSDISAYFSPNVINGINNTLPLPFVPQINNPPGNIPDTLNWTHVEGDFVADGGENYLIIGNYLYDINTVVSMVNPPPGGTLDQVYLYIEDVAVHKCSQKLFAADAGEDKTICRGEIAQIGMPLYQNYHYIWFTSGQALSDTSNVINVSPQTTTTYVLKVMDFAYNISYDSITIFVNDDCLPKPEVMIPNFFSPNNDGYNDVFYLTGKEIKKLHCGIYDRWGHLVFEINDINQGWNGEKNGSDFADGVYFYVADIMFNDGQSVCKHGTVTLLK